MSRQLFIFEPRRLALTALLVGSIGAVLSGAANAYWPGAGSGTGSGTTAAPMAVTLSPGTPAGGLYPGGRADVALTVSNPNAASLHLGALALDTNLGSGGFAVDPGHPGCALSALSFTTQTNAGAGWTLPAKSGADSSTLAVTLTNALSMTADAANACQGAQFTLYLTAGS
jgi:hypothetical protein